MTDLVAAFSRGVPGQDQEDEANLDLLLTVRRDYLSADPRTWHPGDVEQLLLELAPRKVQSDPSLLRDGPAVLGRYLDWLADTRQLRGGGRRQLRAELDDVAGHFAEAMNDPARFGMAKSLLSGVDLGGLDLSDPYALQGVMDEFNARPYEERLALTGGPALSGGPASVPVEELVLPPVALADERELRRAAEQAALVQRVDALLAYVGSEGRLLTQTGALKVTDAKALAPACGDERRLHRPHHWERPVRRMADLPSVHEAYELASVAGLVDVQGSRLHVTGAPDPLARVAALADAALVVGIFVGDVPYLGELVDVVGEELPGVLAVLYGTGEPVSVDELAEHLATELEAHRFTDTIRAYLERAFARFARLGVLERLGVHVPPDRERLGEEVGAITTTVVLTPLGVWWLQRALPAYGFRTPAVGALAAGSARELCLGLIGYPEDAGRAEIDAWRAARGPARAARDLAALLSDDDVLCRQFAAAVLEDDADSVEAVREVLDEPRGRPYAVLWLLSNGVEVPERYHRSEDRLLLFVETAGMLIDIDEAELVNNLSAFGDAGAQAEFVRQLWRVESELTEPVLAAIADGAAPVVSKAARRALFSLRSARGR
ncbi:MAG TPA: hypothetical protein VFR07_13310 [Mycobacteriales bacterium]|nr:hypothetical protein [Mycobacteriales bacterium]